MVLKRDLEKNEMKKRNHGRSAKTRLSDTLSCSLKKVENPHRHISHCAKEGEAVTCDGGGSGGGHLGGLTPGLLGAGGFLMLAE